LHNLMPNGKNSVNTETVQEAARRQLLRFADNNLHIAAYFFEKAIWEVLIPKWELVDWWYRFEWQHHGSVQVHGIAKRKEAPEIDWEKMKNNDEIMEEVKHCLDSLVTTINPDLHASPSD
ncbi:hypothetical protein GLOIN_2v1584893, partial [Rhizophagus irregularis DAOM 181602=DAOM 197198]